MRQVAQLTMIFFAYCNVSYVWDITCFLTLATWTAGQQW